MKAVIYARFSSQNEIEEQIKVCEEYAKEKGYTITKIYSDVGSRKQFKTMIKNSSKKKFKAVIVYSLYRFSRNIYGRAINKNKLNKNGVKLVSTRETIKNNISGSVMDSVLGRMEEYYSAELSEKVMESFKQKKKIIANEGF